VTTAERPAIGDWVCATAGERDDRGIIRRVLERRSTLSRAAAGTAVGEQIVAANVYTIFIVTSFNEDLSANRLDRYLTMVWQSGATPVVVINKMDISPDAAIVVDAMRQRLPFVDVHAVTALAESGVHALSAYLRPACTIAFVGSSGVGKSSLINRLVGDDALAVSGIRDADGKGRHTTTARRLVVLPGGALLIDTPGMRELQPWNGEAGLATTFDDIIQLAAACRFGDCAHESEPDCAVLEAVSDGRLDVERLESFRRLGAEAQFEARKHDKAAAADAKRRWKQLSQAQKALYRQRGRE
jgi:ribosome biogenesis GTPase